MLADAKGKVFRALSDAFVVTGIFAEGHIQAPMHAIFNFPMSADDLPVHCCVTFETTQIKRTSRVVLFHRRRSLTTITTVFSPAIAAVDVTKGSNGTLQT